MRRPKRNIVGLKFNRWTITRALPDYLWECRCDCGTIKSLKTAALTRRYGSSQSCGCLNRERVRAKGRKLIAGERFGTLTILQHDETTRNNRKGHVLCKCDCGKISKSRTYEIINRGTKSCRSCSKYIERGLSAKRYLLTHYKIKAKKRKLAFEISFEQFVSICEKNCTYCNQAPRQVSSPPRCNGTFLYNGIDRKDNKLGYTEANSVPCCGTCNSMKMALGCAEFIAHCSRIVEFSKSTQKP